MASMHAALYILHEKVVRLRCRAWNRDRDFGSDQMTFNPCVFFLVEMSKCSTPAAIPTKPASRNLCECDRMTGTRLSGRQHHSNIAER
mmetsp:Transcript_36456/g.64076  ORF Transcript_36456/g.64076 Transcript_36456/m.64076 type:complete len:88 (+) Transcript_36456:3-266(+)